MANPVITGVTVLYPHNRNGYKLPGETATVIVDAMDSDGLIVKLTLRVVDSQGNSTPTREVDIVQQDELHAEIQSISQGHTASIDPLNKLSIYVT